MTEHGFPGFELSSFHLSDCMGITASAIVRVSGPAGRHTESSACAKVVLYFVASRRGNCTLPMRIIMLVAGAS